MTTLTRVTGKVFGSDAPNDEIGVFGSAKAGSPQNSKDIATIQSLTAYEKGWGSAVISSDNFPPMEEVTGVLNTLSYQICYLLQEGIPVYDAGTEYSNTSIVKVITGNQVDFYLSQQDGNKGKALTSTSWWRKADIVGSREVGVPQITLDPNFTLPNNCIWLEGQEDDIATPDYPYLYNIYGTDYNTDDTPAGKYWLPDFREKYICGVTIGSETNMGYVDAGLPDLQLTTTQDGAHTHDKGTMRIQGSILTPNNNEPLTNADSVTNSGALALTNRTSDWGGGSTSSGAGYRGITFDTDRDSGNGWTGLTGTSGDHTHSVSSANALVGASNTVKVDGIKVRVYTRYEQETSCNTIIIMTE